MSTPRPPRLAELPHRVRTFFIEFPENWAHFREQFQENPAILWQNPVSRIAAIVVLAALFLGGVSQLSGSLVPATPGGSSEAPTDVATLYVACINPECLTSYRTQQPMDFDDWPLTCRQCGAATVYRARSCPDCRKWVANPPGVPPTCPHCVAAKAATTPTDTPDTGPRRTADDDEDPW